MLNEWKFDLCGYLVTNEVNMLWRTEVTAGAHTHTLSKATYAQRGVSLFLPRSLDTKQKAREGGGQGGLKPFLISISLFLFLSIRFRCAHTEITYNI